MTSSVPYICVRCLRSEPTPRLSSSITRLSQAYHTASRQSSLRQQHDALLQRHHPRSTISATRPLSTPRPHQKPTDLSSRTSQFQSSTSPSDATTPPPPPAPPSSTSTTSQQAYPTHTLLNPRSDPDTNEPMVLNLTARAARRLTQIMAKDSNPALCLRVTVESGGCHGFQYLMSLTSLEKVDEAEDVLFVGGGGEAVEMGEWRDVAMGKPKVVVDESSLELLQGSNVDYMMELIGSQFKIDNPRASSSCGCGTSFDVKI